MKIRGCDPSHKCSGMEINMKGKELKNSRYTNWENVKRLTGVQLLQYRSVFYVLLGGIIFFVTLFSVDIASIHFLPEEGRIWEIYSNHNMMGTLFLFMIFLLFFGSYNLLSKDEISMFPGTVTSRYYSTVLIFHILIFTMTLACMLMYLLMGGVISIFTSVWPDLIPYGILEWSYLWRSLLMILARGLAAYGASVLWFALIERFRAWRVYLVSAICLLAIVLSYNRGYSREIKKVLGLYLGTEGSFGTYMLLLFGTWAAGLFLSWLITRSVHCWKRTDKKRLVACMLVVYAMLIATIGGTRAQNGYSYTLELKDFQKRTEHRSASLVDVSALPEEERESLNDLYMGWKVPSGSRYADVFMSLICSVSAAKDAGLDFDASGIDENHVMVLMGSQGLLYNGRDLGKELIRSCEDSIRLEWVEDEEWLEEEMGEEQSLPGVYQVELDKNPVVLLNEALGSQRRYLPNTTLDDYDDMTLNVDGVTGRLLRVVICPDEWHLEPEEE